MDEIAPGVWHWKAKHPKIGVDVSSYFLPGPKLLLDPLLPPEDDRLDELGPPELILLTNRHHLRDSLGLRERFGCAIRAPAPGMHEFADDDPVEPYAWGEEMAGGAVIAHEVGSICPDEGALEIPAVSALACADGVIRYTQECHFVPDFLMDDPEETKQGLKDAYARLADELEFDNLLLAHGEPVIGGGREALRRFASG